ncbi:uncharacterized protein [Rutidosis leptorrhynchoides]|uniref:uncharacterized protein isoform X2 n=1 Tax=Rutidosis leptorrhynchoides TaxID=125765 RepID=UPI003A9A2762
MSDFKAMVVINGCGNFVKESLGFLQLLMVVVSFCGCWGCWGTNNATKVRISRNEQLTSVYAIMEAAYVVLFQDFVHPSASAMGYKHFGTSYYLCSQCFNSRGCAPNCLYLGRWEVIIIF